LATAHRGVADPDRRRAGVDRHPAGTEAVMSIERNGTCSLCGGPYTGFGHNTEPLARTAQRCRDSRDTTKVILARLDQYRAPAGGAATKCPNCGMPMARRLTGEFCMNDDCPGFPKGGER